MMSCPEFAALVAKMRTAQESFQCHGGSIGPVRHYQRMVDDALVELMQAAPLDDQEEEETEHP